MFGKRTKRNLKPDFDEQLLTLLATTKDEWDRAKQNQVAIYDNNSNQLIVETALQRQKYLFLYREARRRNVHGHHIQNSVFDF